MATENVRTPSFFVLQISNHILNDSLQIIMACVAKGLSRQDAHEEIRTLPFPSPIPTF